MNEPQLLLDLAGPKTAGEILRRIRADSRDESEKGRWFEELFMRVARGQPELEVAEIWRWADWPEREVLTGRDGRDIGIDLVARRTTGEWVAIQCKCYDEKHVVPKAGVDSFLGASQQAVFALRWVVATCRWGPTAEKAIQFANPPVRQIDFEEYSNVLVEEAVGERPVQAPLPLQEDAIEDVVEGLRNHDRGRLIMACGTGKTFTSLRISEQLVDVGGCILFAAPTIALVSQARREWLRHTTRPLNSVVVCSDPYAGGRNEQEDLRVSELECPVTTDPEAIAKALSADGGTHVVFCTYQSLRQVTDAQGFHAAPVFDLAIADEAHRTTGVVVERGLSDDGKVDFQAFHRADVLRASKRLYMTATPRLYTQRSKGKLAAQGVKAVDMGTFEYYGPELHRLPFAKAVDHGMLSDYRVIVLGVSQASVTPALRKRLEDLDTGVSRKQAPTSNDMTRVLGVSLAINGMTEGASLDRPGQLPRTMAFANNIRRSKWYAKSLMESEVLRSTTRRLQAGQRAMKVSAEHLDASASALVRNRELRKLAAAGKEGECRVVCNVKLFTEGVDVPELDAVAFLDPRDSQIDVVQAVGRVMRKAEGKRFGYIIVPVIVEPGKNVIDALERGTDGYRTVGRVLRALQAHDGRLAESPATFVRVYEPALPRPPAGTGDGRDIRSDGESLQQVLELQEAEQAIYAHVAAASGLGQPGKLVADEIADTVRYASAVLQEEQLEEPLGKALDLTREDDGGAKGICTVAALMLCNACLLQRRLRDEPEMRTIMRLDKVAGASNPREVLAIAWEAILEKDYAPVFRPALAVLAAVGDSKAVFGAIRAVAECANRIADSLSDFGFDHAGPLYHRILGSAKSDGAFYTNNLSAVMLARLAFTDDWIDWSDPAAVANLRIMDPACGTGTLLMAALQTIKAKVKSAGEPEDEDHDSLHKRLVEDVLCGLDINQHAVQLAACNMTLGAPTVDYQRMNLVTMPHGPQGDGASKAGSLEILTAANDARDLRALTAPQRSLTTLDAEQVNESADIRFPLHDLDAVIMNPPFTDNEKRSRKFGKEAVKRMQQHELAIRDAVQRRDPAAGDVVTTNSISTFFTPLAERLLRSENSTLAKVLPVTGCTGAGGIVERRFLAERFHVESIVTSHDPRRIAFSENTGIHECLLVCRRPPAGPRPPTLFVSLRRMPSSVDQAVAATDAIGRGEVGDWGESLLWPSDRVRDGDWSPAQWYDRELAGIVWGLERHQALVAAGSIVRTGPTGRAAQDSWKRSEDVDEALPVRIFDTVSSDVRQAMLDIAEQPVVPGGRRMHLYERVLAGAGHLLVCNRFDTVSGRLTALCTEEPAFGFGWIPLLGPDREYEHALCAWWNSTPGRLLLLNRRAKKLTYPKWSVKHLQSVPSPRNDTAGAKALARAWEKTCRTPLLPMREAEKCPVRRVIDAAAATLLGVAPDGVADWRRRLAAEPTVTNLRAAGREPSAAP
ncbi:MAG: DEAD/DEAH box helicase family protein [Rhodospirillales bacterium]|nr:DEAD/DEAH box helicase family protein [Rhodospirillales bacterium]